MATKKKKIEPELKVTEVGIIYGNGARNTYSVGKPEGQTFTVLNISVPDGFIVVDLQWDSGKSTRAYFQKSNLAGWDFTIG